MSDTKPRPYGRAEKQRPNHHVMTVLRPDALDAVQRVMKTHKLSRSGAIHHLVRLGAGLSPLL